MAFGQKNDSLFVFVGEKISVDTFSSGIPLLADMTFKAKYKVIETVSGDYNQDTIEFEVWDHYGWPAFSEFDFALLYVVQIKTGELFHVKYLYSRVYPTQNGKWAEPYWPTYTYKRNWYDKYSGKMKVNKNMRLDEMVFADSVWFPIGTISKFGAKSKYPRKYYTIVGDRAYPKKGRYVDEIFQQASEGILKERGYFNETLPRLR